MRRQRTVHLCCSGYLAWHEWADKQYRSGQRQTQCGGCGKWLFPAERHAHVCEKEEPKP